MYLAASTLVVMMFFGMSQPAPDPQSNQPDAAQPSADTPDVQAIETRANLPPGFILKQIKMPDGTTYKYGLFIPPQYEWNSTHKWPVILFLHGSGEVGNKGLKQLKVGLPPRIGTRSDRFPFITICPQAHARWFREQDAAAVWAILDAVLEEYRADPDRVYLTGLSMGGFATWEFACAHPDRFAAIAPICGAGPIEFMSNIVNLPVWAFHGEADNNVPVDNSRRLIAELKRLGAEPIYTEYEKIGHNSWDQAYAEAELYRWFLKHRRPAPPRVIDYRLPSQVAKIWWLTVEANPEADEPPHVRAEILDGNRVAIRSTGVAAFQLTSEGEPLQPGSQIEINWNGVDVYKGAFEGTLLVRPKDPSALPESEPGA